MNFWKQLNAVGFFEPFWYPKAQASCPDTSLKTRRTWSCSKTPTAQPSPTGYLHTNFDPSWDFDTSPELPWPHGHRKQTVPRWQVCSLASQLWVRTRCRSESSRGGEGWADPGNQAPGGTWLVKSIRHFSPLFSIWLSGGFLCLIQSLLPPHPYLPEATYFHVSVSQCHVTHCPVVTVHQPDLLMLLKAYVCLLNIFLDLVRFSRSFSPRRWGIEST